VIVAERVQILKGDCLALLPTLPDNSVDSVVTDPPYELKFMGKDWDGTGVAFRSETWAEVLRVLKPGGHLLAFGGTRTYHRMVCAIEDAGFEIRDCIQWIYGSGFPKSHDVAKGIDKAAGAEREIIQQRTLNNNRFATSGSGVEQEHYRKFDGNANITAPATPEAAQWEGWGTALKPANEPIVLARKPLSEGTVAANVLKWGTGAINIGACRVGLAAGEQPYSYPNGAGGSDPNHMWRGREKGDGHLAQSGNDAGRWPANVVHDGSDEVVRAFPSPHGAGSARDGSSNPRQQQWGCNVANAPENPSTGDMHRFGDSGSAARFFYSAKADSDDRLGSRHPTVKPVDLMAYLCRLVTRPGGTVLDPFAGSGSTGMACMREGFNCILIELDPQSVADIENRIAHVSGYDTPLFSNQLIDPATL
jgi:DNA modification methylase